MSWRETIEQRLDSIEAWQRTFGPDGERVEPPPPYQYDFDDTPDGRKAIRLLERKDQEVKFWIVVSVISWLQIAAIILIAMST